ncbi:hypothetical protein [Candidatus Methanoprimaticola sp. MG2]|uniref:hypothetical protein n=1 Tax=Candidatus Methanoprimaticola sp. MG2 TaxID=3228838 RepID=UPI0039C708AD
MAYDAESVDKLTALYESQSPAAFIAFAMEGLPENYDHDGRFDGAADEEHGGDSKCSYCCCGDNGYCNSLGWHACVVGLVVCCCACCCYVTNGFNGVWTYWPF